MKIQRRNPRQARSKATVDTILTATARILRTEGEAALTTNRVAEVAGVSIGSLYGYFGDKTALMNALADRTLDADEMAIRGALSEAGPDPLRRVVRALIQRHLTDRTVRQIVLMVHVRSGLGQSHTDRATAMISEVADTVFPKDDARPDTTALFVTAHAVLGVCRALTAQATPAVNQSEIEERLMDLIRTQLQLRPQNETGASN